MNCAVPVLRLRRAKLVHVGTRVFGDEAKAREWARSPQPALDGLAQCLSELESLAQGSG